MAGWLQRRFHGGIPLSLCITGLVALFCALYTGIASISAYRQRVELSRTLAEHAFGRAVVNVKDGLASGLLPLQALVDLGATLENNAGGFQQKIKTVTPFFIRSLDDYNSILALNIGSANGDFFAVIAMRSQSVRQVYKAPEGATYVLWYIEVQPDGRRIETMEFRSPTYALLGKRTGDASYDPRTRPWYRDALQSDAQVMTEPYIFSAAKQVGVACSKASKDRQNVFSINILLSDLSNLLDSVPVSAHGFLLLLDKEGHLLASSGGSFAWNKQFFTRPLQEHPDPRFRAAAALLATKGVARSSQAFFEVSEAGGFFSRMPILFGSQEFILVMTAPYEDFAAVSAPFFQTNGGLALILLLLVSLLAYLFAQRLSLSLRRLADSPFGEDLEQGRTLENVAERAAASPVLEIQRLGAVLSRMVASLRERTGQLVDLQERLRQAEKRGSAANFFTPSLAAKSLSTVLLPGKRPTASSPAAGGAVQSQNGRQAKHFGEFGSAAAPVLPLVPDAVENTGDEALQGARILLVESDPVHRQVLVDLLHGDKALVDTAGDSLEAVEKAWLGTYDLALFSVGMPGFDSLTAVRLLRQEKSLDAMPIVVICDEVMGDRERFVADNPEMNGIQDVLVKPVKPDLVRSVLRSWIVAARAQP